MVSFFVQTRYSLMNTIEHLYSKTIGRVVHRKGFAKTRSTNFVKAGRESTEMVIGILELHPWSSSSL